MNTPRIQLNTDTLETPAEPPRLIIGRLALTRFDTIVLAVIGLLLGAILVTAAFGDFSEPGPRVAFLAPARGAIHNIWIADPAQPGKTEQVTFSGEGIYNFGISLDGRYIAFAERNNNVGTTEIKLLDLRTGALQQLTNCVAENADCKTPVWRPDGGIIAYERTDLNTTLPGVGVSPVRVWLLDLTTNPISTYPLFNDSQTLGHSPEWSADGTRIAVFDNSAGGILVHNFLDGTTNLIPSRYGTIGSMSPDGTRVVFPEMTLKGSQMFAHLKIADLSNQQFSELTRPEDPVDDVMPAWNPDGARLAIARQYIDERWTRGHQIYLLTPADGTLETLVFNERYNTSFLEWDPTGSSLVMMRFPELDENGEPNAAGTPEIWAYSMESSALVQLATDAFHPRWVP